MVQKARDSLFHHLVQTLSRLHDDRYVSKNVKPSSNIVIHCDSIKLSSARPGDARFPHSYWRVRLVAQSGGIHDVCCAGALMQQAPEDWYSTLMRTHSARGAACCEVSISAHSEHSKLKSRSRLPAESRPLGVVPRSNDGFVARHLHDEHSEILQC